MIRVFCAIPLAWCLSSFALAQSGSNAGAVNMTVLDPSGAAIRGATITIQNPVSRYTRTGQTGDHGEYQFPNVPYNNYHLAASATAFDAAEQDINVRTPIPVDVKLTLQLATASTSVTVTTEASDLIDVQTDTHTDIDRDLINKLPMQSQSSGLSSLVTLSSPGVSGDSNGMMHGLGDHASNSFSVDGEQISDQQSKAFSNQIPTDSVQSMEVIEGAPPAEYGDKTSLVIVVTTRSGLGTKPVHGEVDASFGSFNSSTAGFNLSYGTNAIGNFLSASGLNTHRFLDTPEFGILHDRGNEYNIFDRFDVKPGQNDTVNFNIQFTRSWFQTPNSYDAQGATAWSGANCLNLGYSIGCNGVGPNGQVVGASDQRSQIRTLNFAPTWTRILNANTVFTFGGSMRQDQYYYYRSRDPFADLVPDLTLQSVGQHRTLTNLGLRSNIAYQKGAHSIKAGVTYTDTILTERDSLGMVDPTANAPCLNGDGSPYVGATLTNPAGCGVASLVANPSFLPILGCYDLTRTAPLPSSDGCRASTSSPYGFYGHANIREFAAFAQDTISVGRFNFNIGLRFDYYDGLVRTHQFEPRLGASYNLRPTHTVLRVSYARTLETPFNENLVLSSTGCNDPVINALYSATPTPCASTSPLGPGWRNEFHAGLQQALGKYLVLDGEYIWKYTHRAYDFAVLGNTPITFPIEWDRSKIPGYAARVTMPERHGVSAYIVMSGVAARFFTPQVSGIGASPGDISVFRIDHDERFNASAHAQYQIKKDGPWIGLTWRYDSGMVAGAVPCAGGSCVNGPNGTNTTVDVSALTPDQQFQAGLFCGSTYATPTTPISASGLCPASQYGSKYLVIPAPGTENDDHNPPRVAGRSLFDIALGDDNLFHTERTKWSARIAVVNVANTVALYNFLSTFSGTHYVTPRAITASIALHF